MRYPDLTGNLYLQLAVLCHATLDGIKKKIDPGPPTELNVYTMSYEERKARGIISLPESLKEAFNNFLSVKRKEWDVYRMQVTTWEVERYMRKL
ncbi:MAG: glutamine synthetase [Candidatus Verstraetearchaeota archaeon]|nr:glutamine synthetase [Candidatus Verstraetearchaeota archaeon]